MSKLLFCKDHILLVADYHDPAMHSHLASHLVVSTARPIEWVIENEAACCKGFFVDSNVRHACVTDCGESIIVLFTGTSKFTQALRHHENEEKRWFSLHDETVQQILEAYRQTEELPALDEAIMRICGLDQIPDYQCDPRIREAIVLLDEQNEIPPDMVNTLSRQVCLSKSRLEHLFREQTGMTLHSYLAFSKLRIAARYLWKGCTITESSMRAGFDSPSHCAATCKRMFGISFRDVLKTLATN